jgi:stage V sporulation protein D (sporulation-specific penicillin-binding protein)
MKPYVVSKILDSAGNVVKANEPVMERQVISQETSKKVCAILETVVNGGESTGANAYVAGYRIAGKTATSEKVGQGSNDYIVSFVGLAPADDPQIAVLVVLDTPDPKTGIYISGGIMAAPAVGRIFADVLPYMGVEPVYSEKELATINEAVPYVKNMGVDEATSKLKDKGFDVRVVGNGGTVTDQIPAANITVIKGTQVIIYAGTAKPTSMASVPNLYGKTYSQAKNSLEAAGMYMRTSGVAASSSSTIVVSDQSVSSGSDVPFGTVVEVTLIQSDTSVMETRG